MRRPDIKIAAPEDLALLHDALERLSADLGDRHRATLSDLRAACFGPHPSCHGLLALDGAGAAGAALVSPVFSTSLGAAGLFVSDLWVAPGWRGRGLGGELLRAAARLGRDRWRVGFLRLTVYDENPRARAFYERLGFQAVERDRTMRAGGAAFDALCRGSD